MSINDRQRHESKQIIFEDHVELGYNYRLTDIQASVGIKQLQKLDWIVQERRRIAAIYNEAFRNIDCISVLLESKDWYVNYQSYIVYIKPSCPISRNDLMQSLFEKGITTRRGIMTAHRETAYKEAYADVQLPVSEDLQNRSIILPLFVPMSDAEINFISQTVLDLLNPFATHLNEEPYKKEHFIF
jgi:dTDP-4-amino-4,6-dideoxygalactose transaminase